MGDDRKTPLWPWIAALLIGLPVLYVASFGPACWLCENDVIAQRHAWLAYRPITWTCTKAPDTISNAILFYAECCGDFRRVSIGRFHHPHLMQDSKSPIDLEIWHDLRRMRLR